MLTFGIIILLNDNIDIIIWLEDNIDIIIWLNDNFIIWTEKIIFSPSDTHI